MLLRTAAACGIGDRCFTLTHLKIFVEKSSRAKLFQNIILLPRFEVAHRLLVLLAAEADLESLLDSRHQDLDQRVLQQLFAKEDDGELDDQFNETATALALQVNNKIDWLVH